MLTEQQSDELFQFFEKYIFALHTMAQDEKEKLGALLSNSLPRIEHAISVAQANSKQIESLESKRLAMQAGMGCADADLNQLLGLLPPARKNAMASLFKQMEKHIDTIKFNNDKSMSVARANITQMNPDAAVLKPSGEGVSTSNPYGSAMSHQAPSSSIFKAKV